MSTAERTTTDSAAAAPGAPVRSSLPLVILPPPVPPSLIRSRAPHPKIPQTKPERTALLEAIRRGFAAKPAVPPLRMEELHARARAAMAEVGLGEINLDYAGVLVNN